MLELSKQCNASMKQSFAVFKEHALDVAIVASGETAPEGGRLRSVMRQAELKKLAQLPLAGLYAVAALLCLITFAAIYFPKLYGPVLLDKARTKFIEWHVAEKAAVAKEAIVDASSKAYTAASSSELAAKGVEYVHAGYGKAAEAYSSVAAVPAVQAMTVKGDEAMGQLRSKLSTELHKLRGAPEEPHANGAAV